MSGVYIAVRFNDGSLSQYMLNIRVGRYQVFVLSTFSKRSDYSCI